MIVRFAIKKPVGIRRTFAITRDVLYSSQDLNVPINSTTKRPQFRQQVGVQDLELDALNKRFLLNRDKSEQRINEVLEVIRSSIIPRLKRAEGENVRDAAINAAMANQSNYDVYSKLWKAKYDNFENENTESANDSAKGEFNKALRLISKFDLKCVSRVEIQYAWKQLKLNERQSRRYGTRVNQLLQQAGRDFQLKLPKRSKNPPQVRHLTIEEFQHQLLPRIEDPLVKLMAQVLFGSGVRYGEAFAFGSASELKKNGTVRVYRQMLEKKYGLEVVARLKNGKPHDTIVLPSFRKAFREWADVPIKIKKEMRASSRIEKVIPSLCKTIFKDSVKQIKNHDLRHSYAIHMLSRVRLDVTAIALLIGDSEQTVKDHYTGHIVTDPHVDYINGLIARSEKELSRSREKSSVRT